MLLERLGDYEGLTEAESAVAGYALANPSDVRAMSIGDLARATSTSKATVTRLAKKMGMESYREFCDTLWAETLERRRMEAIVSGEL